MSVLAGAEKIRLGITSAVACVKAQAGIMAFCAEARKCGVEKVISGKNLFSCEKQCSCRIDVG